MTAITVRREITLVTMLCGECDVSFAMPHHLQQECLEKGRTFYCPNGHPRVYRTTENDKLKERVASLESRLTHAQDQREAAERSNTALKGVVTKKTRQLDRVSKGVCPECNRTFQNLQRHMEGQHPH